MTHTLTFLTGFEHGLVTASNAVGNSYNRMWDAVSGSPAIETTTVRSGSKALRIETSAAAEYVSLALAASVRRLIGSFYFRIVSMPTGGDFRLCSASTTAGGQIFVINTSGQIIAEPGGNAGDRVTGPTLSAGQWYRLDFDFNTSGTNHTIDWKVDGSAKTQAVTTDNPGAQDMTNFRFGTTLAATGTILYEDVVMSQTAADYPLGEYKVLGYPCTDDSTHGSTYANRFRDGAGVDISASNEAWDNLTDLTETTAKVEQYARLAGEDPTTYLIMDHADNTESNPPVAVQGEAAIVSAGTQANNLSVYIYQSIDRNIFSGDPSVTGVAQLFMCWSRLYSGSDWTTSEFNAMSYGMGKSSDVSPVPGVSGIMVEAAYLISGTQTPVNVSGASTNAGTLGRGVGKLLTGASTNAGALFRQVSRLLDGASTNAGALVVQKFTFLTLTGASNNAGTLVQQANKLLTGASTNVGTLVQQANKLLTGASTNTGALARQVTRFLDGVSSNSGALSYYRAFLRLVSGSSDSAGTLTRQISKYPSGSSTNAGTLTRQATRLLTGASTNVGTLARQINKAMSGASTNAGALTRQVTRLLTGASTNAGALTRQVTRLLTGASTNSGMLVRGIGKLLTGASVNAGSLTRQAWKTLSGVSDDTGSLQVVKSGEGAAMAIFWMYYNRMRG